MALKDPVYPRLLSQFESGLNPKNGTNSVDFTELARTLLSAKEIGDLARSIVMAWYFGVWYEWQVPNAGPRFTVVSAEAYTQGWIWRIAQAHAPGWSNLRFGYWAFAPSQSFDLDKIQLKGV